MKSYKIKKARKTLLVINQSYTGETIEQKIHRIVNNKEAITDGAPLIYTDRKDGVQPDYDIRTDRFEVAIDAMDKVAKSKIAQRERRLEALKGGKDDKRDESKNKDGGAEPTQATDKNS